MIIIAFHTEPFVTGRLAKRQMPEYVLRLMEYKAEIENLTSAPNQEIGELGRASV